MSYCLKQGAKVIISCGNGGSMCDAMHFAEELTGRFRDDRDPIAAISISDPQPPDLRGQRSRIRSSVRSICAGPWAGGRRCFACHQHQRQQSQRVTVAETAREKHMHVIGLMGKDGGQLADLSTVEVRVPHDGYADRIQEVHIKVIHAFIDHIERDLAEPSVWRRTDALAYFGAFQIHVARF